MSAVQSCKGCVYAIKLSGDWCCDYLGIVGHSRPRDEAGRCLARKKTEKNQGGWMKIFKANKNWDEVRARSLYNEGFQDSEIARVMGVTRETVYLWRVENGLPTHSKPGRPKKPDSF